MKKSMLLLLCAAMSVGIIAFAEIAPAEKPSENKEVSQVRDDVKRLQAKIELLEYRTRSLESTVEQLKRSHSPTPLNSPAPTGK
jgi:septal ring factor EnvC (AmiA/AmiB activator)